MSVRAAKPRIAELSRHALDAGLALWLCGDAGLP